MTSRRLPADRLRDSACHLLAAEDAAAAIGVSRAWLYAQVLQPGRITPVILGPRCHLIAVTALQAWLDAEATRTMAERTAR
ncbi:MAG TPA: hypothetical protein VMW47_11080 [Verrucomicrobiae bacterium]|nr:hypothetical protein [Verrucomicrobiae bacterium]